MGAGTGQGQSRVAQHLHMGMGVGNGAFHNRRLNLAPHPVLAPLAEQRVLENRFFF